MELIDLKNCNFSIVKCVTSGNGFEEGMFYASIGANNGIQVQRENEEGDCVTMNCCSGGVGKGHINNFDDSGCPSFIAPDEIIILGSF